MYHIRQQPTSTTTTHGLLVISAQARQLSKAILDVKKFQQSALAIQTSDNCKQLLPELT